MQHGPLTGNVIVKSLFEHFAAHGSDSWLAEENGDVVAYARSIVRDGIRQLTDYWVLPQSQTSGIGQELLKGHSENVLKTEDGSSCLHPMAGQWLDI